MAGLNFFAPFEGYYRQAEFENRDRESALNAQRLQQQIADYQAAQEARTTGYEFTAATNKAGLSLLPIKQQAAVSQANMAAAMASAQEVALTPQAVTTLAGNQVATAMNQSQYSMSDSSHKLSLQPLVQETQGIQTRYNLNMADAQADANTPDKMARRWVADVDTGLVNAESALLNAPITARTLFLDNQRRQAVAAGNLANVGAEVKLGGLKMDNAVTGTYTEGIELRYKQMLAEDEGLRKATMYVERSNKLSGAVTSIALNNDMDKANQVAAQIGLEVRWETDNATGIRHLMAKPIGAVEGWQPLVSAMQNPVYKMYADQMSHAYEKAMYYDQRQQQIDQDNRATAAKAATSAAPSLTTPPAKPGVVNTSPVPPGTLLPQGGGAGGSGPAKLDGSQPATGTPTRLLYAINPSNSTPVLGRPGAVQMQPVDTSSVRGFLSSVLRTGIIDTPEKTAFLAKYEAANPRPRAGGSSGVSDARALADWVSRAEAAWAKQNGAQK